MTLEEITQQLYHASERKRACRIQLIGEPIPRTVYPYGIAKSSKDQIVLVCWQKMGFTKAGGKEGYRNLLLEKIAELEILDWHFKKPEDFNPLDTQYKEWVYHI